MMLSFEQHVEVDSGRDDGGLLAILLLLLLLLQVRLPRGDDSGLLPSPSPRDSVHVKVKERLVPTSPAFASSVWPLLFRFGVDLSSQRRRLDATNVM